MTKTGKPWIFGAVALVVIMAFAAPAVYKEIKESRSRDAQAEAEEKAQAFSRDKKTSEAQKQAEEIVAKWPQSAIAHGLLCEIYFKEERWQDANNHCMKAHAFDVQMETPYLIMARLYLRQGQIEYATTYLENLMTLTKSNPEAWLLMAEVAIDQRRPTQAKSFLDNAENLARSRKQEALLAQIAEMRLKTQPRAP